MSQQGDEEMDAYFDEQQIEINKKVADKAASDPEFRAHLLENPQEALEKAGLAEQAGQLAQQSAEEAGEEVGGHAWYHATYYRTCRWWQRGIYWHRT